MKSARLLLFVLCAALTSCVAAPVIVTPAGLSPALPYEVAAEPERHSGAEVIWGGMILALENRENGSEVTILAYPLDRAQRPLPQAGSLGRFIILLPGYVERHDYPDGLFVSLSGRVAGTRAGHVGEQAYVFPLIEAAHVHRWPSGYQFDRVQWHIGVGVSGAGIRYW